MIDENATPRGILDSYTIAGGLMLPKGKTPTRAAIELWQALRLAVLENERIEGQQRDLIVALALANDGSLKLNPVHYDRARDFALLRWDDPATGEIHFKVKAE